MTEDEIVRLVEKAIRDYGWVEFGFYPEIKVTRVSLIGEELAIEATLNQNG